MNEASDSIPRRHLSMADVALITGAAGDIGAATARRLGADGAHLILADIEREPLEFLAGELTEAGIEASHVVLDVTDEASVAAAFATVRDRAGELDVVVNAAGVVVADRFERFSRDDWMRVYEVNVYGCYLCIKHATRLLRASRRQARVVNVASGAGRRPGPMIAPYACAKAAVSSLTRSAAAELAPQVRVNCVSPGVVDGSMWEHLEARLAGLGAPSAARYSQRVSNLPLARAGSAQEVADVIAFLASPASAYVVGQDLNVDGGQQMV